MKNHPFRTSLILIVIYLILMGVLPFAWAAQIRLAWDANDEPDLAGYKLYYGTASQSYGTPVDVGNVADYTLTGLTQGQTYYLSLTAYDSSNNESDHSSEVSGAATDPVQNVARSQSPRDQQGDQVWWTGHPIRHRRISRGL